MISRGCGVCCGLDREGRPCSPPQIYVVVIVPYTAGHFAVVFAAGPVFAITVTVIGVGVALDMDIARGRRDRELQSMDLGGSGSTLEMLLLWVIILEGLARHDNGS